MNLKLSDESGTFVCRDCSESFVKSDNFDGDYDAGRCPYCGSADTVLEVVGDEQE